jgi:transposase InsO family protein
LDFLSDTFGACRKFRILAVNDDCCRENLCLVPDTSISGARVARELDALVRIYGRPACIVSDNGTEFTSKAILKWANDNKVEWHYIDPGKPQQNGYIESFNGSLTALTIGAFILFAPHAFYGSYGITLGEDASLLSELRAPGAGLAGFTASEAGLAVDLRHEGLGAIAALMAPSKPEVA